LRSKLVDLQIIGTGQKLSNYSPRGARQRFRVYSIGLSCLTIPDLFTVLQNDMTRIDLFDDCNSPEFTDTCRTDKGAQQFDAQDLLFTSDPERSWIDFYSLGKFHTLQYQNGSERSQNSKRSSFSGNQNDKIKNAAQLSDVAMIKVRSLSQCLKSLLISVARISILLVACELCSLSLS
jgi:hypothetical protein